MNAQQVHTINSGEAATEIYADTSELGEFVIIRQGDDKVIIPAAPGRAKAQAQALRDCLGAACLA